MRIFSALGVLCVFATPFLMGQSADTSPNNATGAKIQPESITEHRLPLPQETQAAESNNNSEATSGNGSNAKDFACLFPSTGPCTWQSSVKTDDGLVKLDKFHETDVFKIPERDPCQPQHNDGQVVFTDTTKQNRIPETDPVIVPHIQTPPCPAPLKRPCKPGTHDQTIPITDPSCAEPYTPKPCKSTGSPKDKSIPETDPRCKEPEKPHGLTMEDKY